MEASSWCKEQHWLCVTAPWLSTLHWAVKRNSSQSEVKQNNFVHLEKLSLLFLCSPLMRKCQPALIKLPVVLRPRKSLVYNSSLLLPGLLLWVQSSLEESLLTLKPPDTLSTTFPLSSKSPPSSCSLWCFYLLIKASKKLQRRSTLSSVSFHFSFYVFCVSSQSKTESVCKRLRVCDVPLCFTTSKTVIGYGRLRQTVNI